MKVDIFFFLQPIQVSRSLTGIWYIAFINCLYTNVGEFIFNSQFLYFFNFFFYSQVKKKKTSFALFGTELSLAQESILSTRPNSVICEALFTTMSFNYTGYYLLIKIYFERIW